LVKADDISIEILLLTIYDKSESDTLENNEIKEIIKEVLIGRKK